MRRFFLIGTLLLSFSSCQALFNTSVFSGFNANGTLNSTALASASLANVKASLSPTFYAALKADQTSYIALVLTNLYATATLPATSSTDKREACRLGIEIILNASPVKDMVNASLKVLLTNLSNISTLFSSPAQIQPFLRSIFSYNTNPTQVQVLFDNAWLMQKFFSILNANLTTPTKTDATTIQEFYSDYDKGDMVQAGVVLAFVAPFYVDSTGPNDAGFLSMYFDPDLVNNYSSIGISFYSSGLLLTDFGQIGSFFGGTTAALDLLPNWLFLKQVKAELPF